MKNEINVEQIVGEEVKKIFELQKRERIDKIQYLNDSIVKGQILFVGSSLMEQFPINEMLMTKRMHKIVYNRGVGGFTTEDMLKHMQEMVFVLEPTCIFINIGTNDLGKEEYNSKQLLNNYQQILQQIENKLPHTRIYVLAYFPVNEWDKRPAGTWGEILFRHRNNANIHSLNKQLEEMAKERNHVFVNANEGLTDEFGRLKKEYTVEGVHMYSNGYEVILKHLLPYLSESDSRY